MFVRNERGRGEPSTLERFLGQVTSQSRSHNHNGITTILALPVI